MRDIDHIRAEIERMRVQVHRQRGEIRQLDTSKNRWANQR